MNIESLNNFFIFRELPLLLHSRNSHLLFTGIVISQIKITLISPNRVNT